MGNGSSKYSSRHYDYRPFTVPVIPPPSQMTHGNSYTSGSAPPSYELPRRKRKWYQFRARRDRHRGQDVWYSAYVSPRGQQPSTPNIYSAYTPSHQRNPSMPVPVTAQYGSLHIPDGYIPPSVNPPVVPQDVISPRTDPDYWRRAGHSPQYRRPPSQNHHRRPSQSHPPVQPVNPPVMPSLHYSDPTSGTLTSSFSSPPFKPFQPLPEIRRTKPPTPPPKLLDLAPYRDAFPDLSRPTPTSRARALEIIQNTERTDIHLAQEEWKRRDEEREKLIQEKREERERLISGASTIRAPTMQTVTALVVDPTNAQPPPPPPREKRSLWKRLFRPGRSSHSDQQSTARQPTQANGPNVIPIDAQFVLPSIPGLVVPMPVPNDPQPSSSQTLSSPRHIAQPTPTPVIPGRSGTIRSSALPNAVGPQVVMPSPFLQHPPRSTTPDHSPPNAAFNSMPTPGYVSSWGSPAPARF